MDTLDDEQRSVLADYWWSRARGEMTSWVAFGHVLSDLRAERAPQPLLTRAACAVEDEHRHALWCRDWAVKLGHQGGAVEPRAVQPLRLPGASERGNRIARIALCCLTETAGCVLLHNASPVISNPELRAQHRRHLADELQHSQVGWGFLASLDEGQRGCLRRQLPTLLEYLRITCCEGKEEEREELVPFGYFTRRRLVEAHDEAVRELVLPGLEHVDLPGAA